MENRQFIMILTILLIIHSYGLRSSLNIYLCLEQLGDKSESNCNVTTPTGPDKSLSSGPKREKMSVIEDILELLLQDLR